MASLRTQNRALMLALATTFLYAAVSSAQTTPSAASLTYNGSAKQVTGPGGSPVFLLTPAEEYEAGSAFTSTGVVFGSTYSFHTFFQFQMTNTGGSGAADGFTFTIQTQGPQALGANGGDLGYVAITPSVAVEFDTWQNSWDINGNHVAILTDGQTNDLDPQTPYGVTDCQPSTGVFGCLSNGDVWSVWIDYNGTALTVAVADNSTKRPANLIEYPIALASILGPGPAYVGFTGGTGAGYQDHYVLNWVFYNPGT